MLRYETLNTIRTNDNGLTRLLYHMDYHDGPLSGVMLWKGEKVYFKWVTETYFSDPTGHEDDSSSQDKDIISVRIIGVYRLLKEEMDALDKRHSLFQKYVGMHTDYCADSGMRNIGATHDCSQWHHFYDSDSNPPTLTLTEYNCIGHFEL